MHQTGVGKMGNRYRPRRNPGRAAQDARFLLASSAGGNGEFPTPCPLTLTSMNTTTQLTPAQALALVEAHGSVDRAARASNTARADFRDLCRSYHISAARNSSRSSADATHLLDS